MASSSRLPATGSRMSRRCSSTTVCWRRRPRRRSWRCGWPAAAPACRARPAARCTPCSPPWRCNSASASRPCSWWCRSRALPCHPVGPALGDAVVEVVAIGIYSCIENIPIYNQILNRIEIPRDFFNLFGPKDIRTREVLVKIVHQLCLGICCCTVETAARPFERRSPRVFIQPADHVAIIADGTHVLRTIRIKSPNFENLFSPEIRLVHPRNVPLVTRLQQRYPLRRELMGSFRHGPRVY